MARTKRNPELADALNIYKSSLAHQSFIDTNAINSFNSETPNVNNSFINGASAISFPTTSNANNSIISRGSASTYPIVLDPNQNDQMITLPLNASPTDTSDVVNSNKLTYDSLKLTNDTNVNYSCNSHHLEFSNQEYPWTKYCNMETDSSSKESYSSIDNIKINEEASVSTKSDDSTSKETSLALVSTNQNQIVPHDRSKPQNTMVAMDNPMLTYQMKNPDLNRQIDNCINFNTTSLSDIALLKQYLCNDFKQTFKLHGETLEEATKRCFKEGMLFYSVHHLHDLVFLFGLEWGFRGSRYGKTIFCSRADTPNSKKKKKGTPERALVDEYNSTVHNRKLRNTQSYQCGCEWRINFQPIQMLVNNMVRITTISPKHTKTCNPSKDQLVIAKTKARDYAKLTQCKMKEIMVLIDSMPHVPGKILLPFIEQVIPKRKYISSTDIANVRFRAKVLLAKIHKEGSNIHDYKYKVHDISNLVTSLDKDNSDIIEKSVECIKEVYLDYLNDETCSTKMFGMLERCSRIDPGFTYNIAFDNDNRATGVVWMTPTMRSNLHRFGSFICLDAMKRTTNVYEWPYIGPTILNDMNRIGVVCEAFCINETKDAYKFILSSMIKMAPNFNPLNIKAIFADEFLDQKTIDEGGLPNTRLIYDHYHYHLTLIKNIGVMYNEMYRPMFTTLLNASSENEFNSLVAKAQHDYRDNFKVLKEINDVISKKEHLIAYVIDSINGTCCKRGSTHAEQNHSSIVSFIGKEYTGELEELLKFLLQRQDLLNLRLNKELSVANSHMLLTHERLTKMKENQILIDASKHLTKLSYDRFVLAYIQSKEYAVEETDNNSFIVYRKSTQRASPRKFSTFQTRCNCRFAVSFHEQCCHEIKLLNKFDIKLFSSRHIVRSGITMKQNVQGYTNPHSYSHLRIESYKPPTFGIYEDDEINMHEDDTEDSSLVNEETTLASSISLGQYSQYEQKNDKRVKLSSKNHLSYKEAQDLLSKIYTACNRNKNLHVVVGGFLIQLLNTVQDKKVSTVTSLMDMEVEFTRLIQNFNSSFNTIDMYNDSNIVNIGMSKPIPNVHFASKNRYKSVAEQHISKKRASTKSHSISKSVDMPISFRKVSKKTKACGFCQQPGHIASGCPRKKSLGDLVDYDTLIYDMENTIQFCIASSEDMIMDNFNSSGIYHMTINYLKSKVQPGTDRPHTCKFVCNISCYDRFAILIQGYDNILVPMKRITAHIQSIRNTKTKKVFSKLKDSYGSHFVDFDRQVPLALLTPQFSERLSNNDYANHSITNIARNKSKKRKLGNPIVQQIISSLGFDDDDYKKEESLSTNTLDSQIQEIFPDDVNDFI